MAQFLKSRAGPSPAEILAQNRETLLSRIAAWGKYDDYEQPIGLLDEAAEEIKRLRAELAAAH